MATLDSMMDRPDREKKERLSKKLKDVDAKKLLCSGLKRCEEGL